MLALALALPALGLAAFTPSPFLPPLLTYDNGTTVATAGQWPARRAEVATLLQDHILGTLPPAGAAPLTRAEVINTTQIGGGSTSSLVKLTFDVHQGGTETDTVSFIIEILKPPAPEKFGPLPALPVFLTQWTHRQWALIGLNRGFLSVVYPGADQGTDAAPLFQAAFPQSSMALIIARAFVASRTLDYILTLPCKFNPQAIHRQGQHP